MLGVKKYRIPDENIDEKEYLIGVGITSAQVISLEEMRSEKNIGRG